MSEDYDSSDSEDEGEYVPDDYNPDDEGFDDDNPYKDGPLEDMVKSNELYDVDNKAHSEPEYPHWERKTQAYT